jgi:hypothetical protein
MKGRCNQADRAKRLRENGGRPEYDKKVVKALDWLKSQQNADGSWGNGYPVAMTGFAFLAFSGHCETVDSPKYGPNLVKAINYLIKSGGDNNGNMGAPGGHLSYEHGIAVYALSEEKAARSGTNTTTPCRRWSSTPRRQTAVSRSVPATWAAKLPATARSTIPACARS